MSGPRIAVLVLAAVLGLAIEADAHRSGCHRWHSCPSDTGSYTCGDLGYCSQCPDNQYCESGQPRLVRRSPPQAPSSAASPGSPNPDTWAQAAGPGAVAPLTGGTCPATHPIKGNFTTYSGERCIYHAPGGQFYYRTRPERCYTAEQDAV